MGLGLTVEASGGRRVVEPPRRAAPTIAGSSGRRRRCCWVGLGAAAGEGRERLGLFVVDGGGVVVVRVCAMGVRLCRDGQTQPCVMSCVVRCA